MAAQFHFNFHQSKGVSIPFQAAVSSPLVPLQKPECWTPGPLCTPRVRGRFLLQFAGPSVSTTATILTELSQFPYLPYIHFKVILQSMTIIFVTLQYTLRRAAQANTSSAPVHCPNMQFSLPYYFTLTQFETATLNLSFSFRFFILKILQTCIKHNFHIPTLFSY
jgi:hypothetical protein